MNWEQMNFGDDYLLDASVMTAYIHRMQGQWHLTIPHLKIEQAFDNLLDATATAETSIKAYLRRLLESLDALEAPSSQCENDPYPDV